MIRAGVVVLPCGIIERDWQRRALHRMACLAVGDAVTGEKTEGGICCECPGAVAGRAVAGKSDAQEQWPVNRMALILTIREVCGGVRWGADGIIFAARCVCGGDRCELLPGRRWVHSLAVMRRIRSSWSVECEERCGNMRRDRVIAQTTPSGGRRVRSEAGLAANG